MDNHILSNNPYVVHCKKSKFDVYIGRPSIWGNPFVIGRDGTREDVVRKYKQCILSNSDLLSKVKKLKGKILACWCSPEACHGDVLVELANKEEHSSEEMYKTLKQRSKELQSTPVKWRDYYD